MFISYTQLNGLMLLHHCNILVSSDFQLFFRWVIIFIGVCVAAVISVRRIMELV